VPTGFSCASVPADAPSTLPIGTSDARRQLVSRPLSDGSRSNDTDVEIVLQLVAARVAEENTNVGLSQERIIEVVLEMARPQLKEPIPRSETATGVAA
jgi:hypothetical protein